MILEQSHLLPPPGGEKKKKISNPLCHRMLSFLISQLNHDNGHGCYSLGLGGLWPSWETVLVAQAFQEWQPNESKKLGFSFRVVFLL